MAVCATLVSCGGLLFRNFSDIDIFEAVFFRSLALLGFIGFLLSYSHGRNVFRTITGIGRWGVLGAIVFAGAQTSYIAAFSLTSVANTTFTLCVTPFITAVFAYFFLREKISLPTFLCMMVAGVGVGIMVSGSLQAGSMLGNILALLTSFFFALFAVILRKNRDINMLPTLMVTGVFMMFLGAFMGSWENRVPVRDIALCFLWGGLLQGFAHSLMIRATRVLKAAEITLVMLLEFTLGPVWVWIFVSERPTETTLIGGAVIVVSVLGLAIYELFYLEGNLRRHTRND